MRFVKMQGIGNDYLYINGEEETIPDPSRLAREMSDRHYGVGSDGIVIIRRSESADFSMEMYNRDGSRGRMCGNAARCIGKYVYETGMTQKTDILLETLSGHRRLFLQVDSGCVRSVRVDMGAPAFSDPMLPTGAREGRCFSVETPSGPVLGMPVSMGNPHFVIETHDLDAWDLPRIGPVVEHAGIFPEGVNTEFVEIISDHALRMRVWERGSGETLACGTGACAAVAALSVQGRCAREVDMELKGGNLRILWDDKDGHIYQEGPAAFVFAGTWQEERKTVCF